MTRRNILVVAVISAFLGNTAYADTSVTVRGNESITTDGYLPYLQLQDTGKATLKKGSKISHLSMGDNSEITLEDGADVSHLTASGKSTVVISGATVSFLTMVGNSQAHIHLVNILGGTFSAPGVSVGGGAIVYTSGAKLHIYADNVTFLEGKLTGNWKNGERFSIWIIERIGLQNHESFQLPQTIPTQLIVHELPGPSFECRKASITSEKIICAHEDLSRLDKELSNTYKRLLAVSPTAYEIKLSQRNWLAEQRNKCQDKACLKTSYESRLREIITGSHWMTNDKARAICATVVDAINDGTIGKRFESFRPATENERNTWQAANPNLGLYLNKTLNIETHGRAATLGMLVGGGTCGNCDIVDIAAKAIELYPPDDEKERFRWASWGMCDHFLFVDGEPIVVTGNFRWGKSQASLVAWVAPDGAKRAMCYLGSSGEIKSKMVRDEDPALCRAVTTGAVEALPWTESVSLPQKETNMHGEVIGSGKGALVDLDLDGKKDLIVMTGYDSGAGCGSSHQWLVPLSPDAQSVQTTALSAFLKGKELGPIEGPRQNDSLFSLRLFKHRGKPYVLGRGTNSSAEVTSYWRDEQKTWCEFQLLPQHRVEVFYPVETWPTSPH